MLCSSLVKYTVRVSGHWEQTVGLWDPEIIGPWEHRALATFDPKNLGPLEPRTRDT